MEEILKYGHLNEAIAQCFPALFVYYAAQGGSNVCICD